MLSTKVIKPVSQSKQIDQPDGQFLFSAFLASSILILSPPLKATIKASL
jgi:hypothetical protein